MKTRLAVLMVLAMGGLAALGAGSFEYVWLPGSWPAATWWTNSPPLTTIATSNAWLAVNQNFLRASNTFDAFDARLSGDEGSLSDAISALLPIAGGSMSGGLTNGYGFYGNGVGLTNIPSAGIAGLPDAQTNAMLNSGRFVWGITNWLYATNSTTNLISATFSNFAGVTYTATSGVTVVLWSTDGTNYSLGGESLITNVPVHIGFYGGNSWPGGGTAINGDAGLTNVVFYGLSRADLFGKTNQVIGQKLKVGNPIDADDAVPLSYFQNLLGSNQWWVANQDMDIQGHSLHLSSSWELVSPMAVNVQDTVSLKWLGTTILSATQPAATTITNIAGGLDGTKTNALIKIATNGLSAAPTLEYTHYLQPAHWAYLTNVASVVGTNYQWTVALPYKDLFFVGAATPSANPGLLTIYDVLNLPTRTVTSSNSTTWGYGAGIVCADTNYLYISVGTNAWKRVGVSSW